MMDFKWFFVVILFLTLQSCVVYNSTKNNDQKICIVHNEKLKKALVGTTYGFYCKGNKAEYINAKRKKCMGCVKPYWTIKRLALVYHCEKCDKIKKDSQKSEK